MRCTARWRTQVQCYVRRRQRLQRRVSHAGDLCPLTEIKFLFSGSPGQSAHPSSLFETFAKRDSGQKAISWSFEIPATTERNTQRNSLFVILSLSEITVWIDDDRLAALSLRKNRMRQPFFDDQPESQPVSSTITSGRSRSASARSSRPSPVEPTTKHSPDSTAVVSASIAG